MNTELSKLFTFVCGTISFFIGCAFLILFIITILNIEVSVIGIIGSISILALLALSFYISINSFIKYGIALGIDYALEQKKLMKTE